MIIDCDLCEVRGLACSDCVVSVLLGVPDDGAVLDQPEQEAIVALAEAGLVPPLRLAVPARPAGGHGSSAARTTVRRGSKARDGAGATGPNDSETPGARHLPARRSAG